MDSNNRQKEKNKKHIIIKRKNKIQNEDNKKDLAFNGKYNPNIFKTLNVKNENNDNKINKSNYDKMISLKRPLIRINLVSTNENNQKRISISSEKKNKPISYKVHKSKPKKIDKMRNMNTNIYEYKKNLNHNSIQLAKNFFTNADESSEQIFKNNNISFSNYFNIAQQNNLKVLDNHLDNLIKNKKTILKKGALQNETKTNYINGNIKQKEFNKINEYNYKPSKPNIYRKKTIRQKFSFSKTRTNSHSNTISDISNLTIEKKVNQQVDPKIFNQLIKNRLKNKKTLKIIPNFNNQRNRNRNIIPHAINSEYISLSSNSSSKINSSLNPQKKKKKFTKKIEIDLENDDINIYKNNFYIYNYINRDNNSSTSNQINNPY